MAPGVIMSKRNATFILKMVTIYPFIGKVVYISGMFGPQRKLDFAYIPLLQKIKWDHWTGFNRKVSVAKRREQRPESIIDNLSSDFAKNDPKSAPRARNLSKIFAQPNNFKSKVKVG